MPFDSNGTFNRVIPGGWQADAAAGIKITAVRHDNEDDGFATGLTTCITKDGRTQPTANIPMNGKKLVNLGEPTTGTDASTKNYVDNVKTFNTGMSIGGADANGRLTFTSPTGVNGLSWTGADLSWVARLATVSPDFRPNRLCFNDKPDASGTDRVTLNDNGVVTVAGTGYITNNVYLSNDNSTWRAINAGYSGIYQIAADGTFNWYANRTSAAAGGTVTNTQNMSLDRSGNLNVTGTLSAPSASFSGACNAGASTIGGISLSGNSVSAPSNIHAGGQIDSNTVVANSITSNGGINAGGQITSNANVVAGSTLYASGTNMALGPGGSGRIMQFQSSWYWDWNSGTGELRWIANGQWHSFKTDGAFWISGSTGAKTVAGQWVAWSDARIKTVLGDYTLGLRELMKIQPRRFFLNRDKDRTEHVGMVAQEVEKCFPETVKKLAVDEDGLKFKDLRQFDPTNLMYACINAIKELKGLLDDANARIAALEAK